MMHEYHEGLPGFHPEQIFHDGCGECERRGADVDLALMNMDNPTFERAWSRARWFLAGEGPGAQHIARAEVNLLNVLGQVARRFDQLGARR